MSTDCQGTKRRRKIFENFKRLHEYRVHQRYRRTGDSIWRTFAKKLGKNEKQKTELLRRNGLVLIK